MKLRFASTWGALVPFAGLAAGVFLACSSGDPVPSRDTSPLDASTPAVHDASIDSPGDAGADSPVEDADGGREGGSAGRLDLSFGDGGTFVLPVDYLTPFAGAGSIRDLRVRADGRLVALVDVPGADGGTSSFLVQILADGSGLDPAFAHGGFLALSGAATAVALEDDGKIVVATNETYFAQLTRLLPDGSPDLGFGAVVDGGARGGTSNPISLGSVRYLQVDRQGRTLLATWSSSTFGGGSNVYVSRLTTEGDVDPSFGSGGTGTFNAPSGIISLTGIVQQTNGRLVLVGAASTDWEFEAPFVFATYDDGSIDPTFGAQNPPAWDAGAPAAFTLPWAREATVLSVERADDNEITIVGSTAKTVSPPDPAPQVAITKLSPTGEINRAFADGGAAFSAPVPGLATAVAPASGAHFVLEGDVYPAIVARTLPDGTADLSFGSVAIAASAASPASASSWFSTVVAQGGGAVVAGVTSIGDRPAFTLVKVR